MDVSSRGENPSGPTIDGTGGHPGISGIGRAAEDESGETAASAKIHKPDGINEAVRYPNESLAAAGQ